MSTDKSQKTEQPTPRRKKEARQEGQIAKSQDIYAWVAVLVGSFVVPVLVGAIGSRLMDGLADLGQVVHQPEPAVMGRVALSLVTSVLLVLSIFLVGAMLLSIGVNLAQVGFVLSGKGMKPKFSRISPAQGFKRLFSVRTAWQAVTGIAKMAAVGLVSIPLLYGVASDLVGGLQFDLNAGISYVGTSTLSVVRITAIVGLMIAAADYGFQRWKTNKDMMMSKQEIKQEMRNTEGDPHVKARQRSMRMSASRNRMIASVADADVVITNPTHVAVAISYRPETGAPRVVARGGDSVATKIRYAARDAEVPIVESRPLARALYASCRIDDEIPRELYEGVATVLAFVHRLKRRPTVTGEHILEVPVSWDPEMSDLSEGRRRRRRDRVRDRTNPANPHPATPEADHLAD